jgi:hypothetical protein
VENFDKWNSTKSKEILQEEKIKYQLKDVYNSEYPNSSIPNEVFKPKDYYSFIKDKWEAISTGAYYIDQKAKIKYDKPNMRFDIECHDGMTKAKYGAMSEIVIKDIKKWRKEQREKIGKEEKKENKVILIEKPNKNERNNQPILIKKTNQSEEKSPAIIKKTVEEPQKMSEPIEISKPVKEEKKVAEILIIISKQKKKLHEQKNPQNSKH